MLHANGNSERNLAARFKGSAHSLFSFRAALLLALSALAASSLYVVAPVIGDLDGDGQTTVLDLTRLVNHVTGQTPPTSTNLALADVNGDGLVDALTTNLAGGGMLNFTSLLAPAIPNQFFSILELP